MKRLKIFGAVRFIILALFVAATENFAQQPLVVGELIFGAQGLNGDEYLNITLQANDNLTRWTSTNNNKPYLPNFLNVYKDLKLLLKFP